MDMTGQPRLFRTAVEAGMMQLSYDGYQGWSLMIRARRSGDEWTDEPATFYGGLSTAELLDAICAEWGSILGG